MKTAITLFAIIGMTAVQAYAAPAVDQAPLNGVPMNVATRLKATPTFDTSALTIEKSGVPMRVAARASQQTQAPQTVAADSASIRLSGLRMCHAKRT
jgi:hypothetical protein